MFPNISGAFEIKKKTPKTTETSPQTLNLEAETKLKVNKRQTQKGEKKKHNNKDTILQKNLENPAPKKASQQIASWCVWVCDPRCVALVLMSWGPWPWILTPVSLRPQHKMDIEQKK